jgi:hypothetical protein
MSGNRKHGFMRGSAAGRNGVGSPKGFYCDACEKEHGGSVDRMGLKHMIGRDVLVCDRKYFTMKEDQLKSQQDRLKAIAKLKRLKVKVSLVGDKGLKARVDFICTTFKFDLKEFLVSYELFDEHNIGERDFDTCFEMHDGDSVIHEIIKQANKSYWLKLMLKKGLGAECYNEWVLVFERAEESNQAPLNELHNISQLNLAI